MGATPAKQFPQPGSYAMDNENVVAPQDPTPIIPQQQFVSMNSYSQAGAPPAAAPVNNGRQNVRGKFFGDMELGDNGNPLRQQKKVASKPRAFIGPDVQPIKNPYSQF